MFNQILNAFSNIFHSDIFWKYLYPFIASIITLIIGDRGWKFFHKHQEQLSIIRTSPQLSVSRKCENQKISQDVTAYLVLLNVYKQQDNSDKNQNPPLPLLQFQQLANNDYLTTSCTELIIENNSNIGASIANFYCIIDNKKIAVDMQKTTYDGLIRPHVHLAFYVSEISPTKLEIHFMGKTLEYALNIKGDYVTPTIKSRKSK